MFDAINTGPGLEARGFSAEFRVAGPSNIVPEPSTYVLLATGIGALGLVDEGQLYLAGMVADTDGSRILRVHQVGDVKNASAVGRAAADELLAKGAGEILAAVRARVASPEPAAP